MPGNADRELLERARHVADLLYLLPEENRDYVERLMMAILVVMIDDAVKRKRKRR